MSVFLPVLYAENRRSIIDLTDRRLWLGKTSGGKDGECLIQDVYRIGR